MMFHPMHLHGHIASAQGGIFISRAWTQRTTLRLLRPGPTRKRPRSLRVIAQTVPGSAPALGYAW
ncbi:hypothetical protein [Nocardia abscessus]|uniref:hypothetical protein n=1 Tax=Nocardia abscessus TaxID=120957 RepID=UPI003CC7D0D9